jgi:glycosyltransferase involved in cell wall biosynthesis
VDLGDLRIGFIAGTLGQGGAEHQLFYILRALCRAGAQPYVLCLTRGEYWEERIRSLGVPVVWVGQARSRWRRLAAIVNAARARPTHILQSHHFYLNLYAVAAARILRVQEVGAIRSNVLSEVRESGKLGGSLSLRVPRRIAANSRAAVETAAALGVKSARLHYLPNVVDTGLFKPAVRSPEDPVRLLIAGRLTGEKRIDRFLSVLAVVSKRTNKKVCAVIAGEGPLRRQLEEQARDLGLAQTVEFAGLVQDLLPYYQSCHIFVLTSDWEGTPNVVLEAMACGLPVVSTRVGGVPEMIRNGETGFLVGGQDHDEMANVLLDLIHSPDRRRVVGCRAREYVESRRSVEQLPGLLQDLYGDVLA